MIGKSKQGIVMPARFVDLEGIDQSGKETQARLLLREFRRQGLETVSLDFPVYSSRIGREIRAFLNGERTYSSREVHMLYSLNRWENRDRILEALDSADVVMTDRYTPSNLAYGLAKGLDLEWLANLDRGLPEPGKVVVLDVPVEHSFIRKPKGRDIHEKDSTLLCRVRKNYLNLAARFGWRVVDANRPAEIVHREILDKVLAKYVGIKHKVVRRPNHPQSNLQ